MSKTQIEKIDKETQVRVLLHHLRSLDEEHSNHLIWSLLPSLNIKKVFCTCVVDAFSRCYHYICLNVQNGWTLKLKTKRIELRKIGSDCFCIINETTHVKRLLDVLQHQMGFNSREAQKAVSLYLRGKKPLGYAIMKNLKGSV